MLINHSIKCKSIPLNSWCWRTQRLALLSIGSIIYLFVSVSLWTNCCCDCIVSHPKSIRAQIGTRTMANPFNREEKKRSSKCAERGDLFHCLKRNMHSRCRAAGLGWLREEGNENSKQRRRCHCGAWNHDDDDENNESRVRDAKHQTTRGKLNEKYITNNNNNHI